MRKMCLLSFLLLLLTLPFLVHGRGQRLGTLYSKPGASRTGYIPASLETVNILAAKERELRIRTITCPAENFDEEWDRCVAAYLSAGGSRAIEAKRSAYRESIAEKKGN